MIEVVLLAALVLLGWLVVDGDDAWRLAAALPVGLAVLVLVELALLATSLPIAHPRLALAVGLVAAAVLARVRGLAVRPTDWRVPAAGGALIVVVTAVTWWLPVVTVSADSFRYLSMSGLLADLGDTSAMSPFLLQSRGLAVGAVHGLAGPDPGYLRAVGPLIGLATAGMLWVLVREGTAELDAQLRRWLALGAVALLLTNHRVIFSALYINGHMLFAAWLLAVVGTTWRWSRDAEASRMSTPTASPAATPSVWTAATCAGALVVLRPEGALVALLALVPAALDQDVPVARRRWLLAAVGIVLVVWHGVVLVAFYWGAALVTEPSVLGMLALGVVVLLLAAGLPLLGGRTGRRPLLVLHGLAWAAVVALSARNPDVFIDSADATAQNVLWEGRWGASLLVLAVLLVVTLAVRRVPAEATLLFPLFTFVPLVLLLAFLRDSAYRVGPGDSLNRMLLHVVPIAILALALTADGEPRRSWRASRRDEPSAEPAR